MTTWSKRRGSPSDASTSTPSPERRTERTGRSMSDPVREVARQALDVGAASSVDGLPGRPSGQLQEPVVVTEADEGRRRVVRDLRRRRRPHRRGHRIEVVVAEGVAVAAVAKIVAERHARQGADVARRLAVEAHEVAHHRPEARPHHIGRLRQQAGEVAAVFEPSAVQRHGKRHLGRLDRNAKMLKQRDEVRVCRFVIDDEAGVDRHPSGIDGVAVSRRRGRPPRTG